MLLSVILVLNGFEKYAGEKGVGLKVECNKTTEDTTILALSARGAKQFGKVKEERRERTSGERSNLQSNMDDLWVNGGVKGDANIIITA